MIKITKKKIILFIPIILVVVYLLFYGMMYFLASVQFNNEKYVDASNYCKLLITIGNTKIDKYRLYGKYARYYENFNETYDEYSISTENAINEEFFDLTYGLYDIRKYQNEYYLSEFENNVLNEIAKLYLEKLSSVFVMTEHEAISFVDSYEGLSIEDVKVVSSAFAKNLYKNLLELLKNDSSPLVISDISLIDNSLYTVASGTITNRGYTNVSFVKIKGIFVSASGRTIDTDWTYAVDSVGLAPGESKKWEMSVIKDDDISKVNVEIIDYERR